MSELDNTKLMNVIERLERLNDEIFELNQDKKQVMAEAKGDGFNVKAIAHVIKQRKLDKTKRDEEQNLFAVYEHAVGLDQ